MSVGSAADVELLLDLEHELGNLLSGARLAANLLERDPGGAADLAHDLEAQVSLAAALVAHVRPLVRDPSDLATRVAAADVVEAVQRALVQPLDAMRCEPGDDVCVSASPDALHHMLVVLAHHARFAAGKSGQVSLVVALCDGVAFRLCDDGVAPGPDDRHGRGLALRLVGAVAQRMGGALSVERTPSGTEVTLRLPGAER